MRKTWVDRRGVSLARCGARVSQGYDPVLDRIGNRPSWRGVPGG